jgi:ferredoxin
MGETLQIDRIRCDGHGLCAELLPELIRLDDWGYPIIKAGTIPPSLIEHARRAADACPVLALRLASMTAVSAGAIRLGLGG